MSTGYWNVNSNFISPSATFSSLSISNMTVANIFYTGSIIQNGTSANVLNSTQNFIATNLTSNSIIITGGSLRAIGNSNTIGSLFTTGGNVGINNTNPIFANDILGTMRVSNKIHLGTNNITNIGSLINANNNNGQIWMYSSNSDLLPWQILSNTNGTLSLNKYGSLSYIFFDQDSNITATSLLATTSISTGILNATNTLSTNNTLTNLILTSGSFGSLSSANISVSGNITVGGNLLVNGTLISVNITTLNVINTNISAGTLNATNTTTVNLVSTNSSLGTINSTGQTTGSIRSIRSATVLINPVTPLAGSFPYVDGNWGFLLRSPNATPGLADFQFQNFNAVPILTITSTGNIGIGTTAPSALLDVNGSLEVLGNSNTIGNIFTTGGNVGINTITPAFTLDVIGTGRITNIIGTNINSTNLTVSNMILNDNSAINIDAAGQGRLAFVKKAGGGPTIATSNNAGLFFQVANTTDASAVITNTYTTTMILTTQGNLSVGSVFTGNITSTNLVGTNITSTNLVGTTSTIPNSIFTNITSSTILSNSLQIQNPGLQIYSGLNITNNRQLWIGDSNYSAQSNTTGVFRVGIIQGSIPNVYIGCVSNDGTTVLPLTVASPLYANTNTNTLGNLFTTGGNVGINITNPVYRLDISGTSRISTRLDIGGTQPSFASNTIGQLFLTGPTNTLSGPHLLMSTSQDQFPTVHLINYLHDNIALHFDSYYDGLFRTSSNSTAFQLYKFGNQLSFNYANGSAGSAQTFTAAMVIGSTGNISVNTLSASRSSGALVIGSDSFGIASIPSTQMYIAGNRTATQNCAGIGFQRSGVRVSSMGIDTNNNMAFALQSTADNYYFKSNVSDYNNTTSGNFLMSILGNGNMGIGTTSPLTSLSITPSSVGSKITLWDNGNASQHFGFGISSGQLNYHVDANTSSHVFYAGGKNGDGTQLFRMNSTQFIMYNNSQMYLQAGDTNGDARLNVRDFAGNCISFYVGTTKVGSITASGSVTTYNTSSDYRLKENVVPLVNALSRVNQLSVHRFNFKSDTTKTIDGFLAHEVADVVPESIHGEKDAVDSNGNIIIQQIDQSKLVPLLTASIQELHQKINELKSEIEILKQKVN